MVGRAIVLGILTGGSIGVVVMLGFGVVDVGEYEAGAMVAIAVIYLPLAFGAGAMAGLVHALLAVAALLALRPAVDQHVTRARTVAAVAAAVPGLVAIAMGVPFVWGVPFAIVAGAAAAFWTPRVIGLAR